ncbi:MULTISPECIES: hypothetical protein [unclassified Chitinophaga]|uniref:hypothetical protein n=1 Tax=unclassified Chitinophaga TaxID=2619133 RepID=UPI0009D04C37|nr:MULTISPECIES: hypothetical protein [unclassified Chitinophaga]OMP79006.1 hypothetical protein BW716_11635 [[Flexibacter] sp. ATCC 35208]WPV70226.1 hypothetical protein QQL36_16085 [Chitinophaga sp. LS1]
MANKTKTTNDIQDSKHDQDRMKPETTIIDMPEVNDIPGQENVEPLLPDAGHVSTPASDDEEGYGVLDDLNGSPKDTIETDDEQLITDERSNVSRQERQDLYESANVTPGDEGASDLKRAQLDNVDEEGELLEEQTGQISGEDLDVPGSELDDDNEGTGAEDEENNSYSVGGDRNEL